MRYMYISTENTKDRVVYKTLSQDNPPISQHFEHYLHWSLAALKNKSPTVKHVYFAIIKFSRFLGFE